MRLKQNDTVGRIGLVDASHDGFKVIVIALRDREVCTELAETVGQQTRRQYMQYFEKGSELLS